MTQTDIEWRQFEVNATANAIRREVSRISNAMQSADVADLHHHAEPLRIVTERLSVLSAMWNSLP